VHPNANPTLPNIRQGVIQDDLQTFLFHMSDMHILTLKIEKDMEFQRGLVLKQFLEILNFSENLITFNCVLIFETNYS
jgi:hypothetical protein